MTPLILLTDISYSYNRGKPNEVTALSKISLSIKKGDFIGIMGASGSGKSTLLHTLGGFLKPDQGEYLYKGIDIRQLSEQTKEATARITEIIQYLIEDTQKANESIQSSVEAVSSQSTLIDQTREQFGDVGKNVETLLANIHTAEQSIQEILNSTSAISDNITHLSATGEEVAAASTEGMRVTAETVESMKKCKEILNNIYLLAEDLKSSVQE